MPEKRQLGTIHEITDCDTGMYHIGEVDGGFQSTLLRQHIDKHGSDGVLRQLAYMTHSVIDIQREINSGNSGSDQAVASVTKEP